MRQGLSHQCRGLFSATPKISTITAKTAVLATGFQLTPIDQKTEYGQGRVHNVITSLQMERLLAPHGPYQRVLRPSDGKEPESIAYVQCAGSRDKSLGIPYCSRVCCMYAIKQAMLLSGALPLADITIYYMDIRAFGKGYEQFYQNAKAMGIEFVKAKVASIRRRRDQSVALRYEAQEEDGRLATREHDLVVLSLGIVPDWNRPGYASLATAEDAFIQLCHAPDRSDGDHHGRGLCGRSGGRSQGYRRYHRRGRRRGHGGGQLSDAKHGKSDNGCRIARPKNGAANTAGDTDDGSNR